jgi:hypothetical protein
MQNKARLPTAVPSMAERSGRIGSLPQGEEVLEQEGRSFSPKAIVRIAVFFRQPTEVLFFR